jgi:ferredoxin
MKVCPTNGLHPALGEAGLEGVFTPRLVPRIGWCENNCNLCTQICPTGALHPVSIEERETLVLGTAVIIRDICIPWSEGRNCIVCEEMCPTATKSIKFIEETVIQSDGTGMTLKKPYVLNNVCIGCGICENKCPVRRSAAIRVRRRKDEVKKGVI